jgi:hypothetical protein
MSEQQALDVFKQVLDLSVQKGVFQNAESVGVAIQAYSVFAQAVKDKDQAVIAE